MKRSDLCTAAPDLFPRCCRQHDADYRAGVPRLHADRRMLRCMLRAAGSLLRRARRDEPVWAPLWAAVALLTALAGLVFYAAVRLFGGLFYRRHSGDRC